MVKGTVRKIKRRLYKKVQCEVQISEMLSCIPFSMFNDQKLTIDGETTLGSSPQSTIHSEQLIINYQLLIVNFKNTSSGEDEYILPSCLSWVMVVLLSYFVSIVRLSSERNAERCLPVFFRTKCKVGSWKWNSLSVFVNYLFSTVSSKRRTFSHLLYIHSQSNLVRAGIFRFFPSRAIAFQLSVNNENYKI